MAMIEAKARLVLADMAGGAPAAGGIGALLPIIVQILTTLLGSGGLGFCKPTSGGQVKQILTHPNRRQQRILRRTVRNAIDDPALAANAEEAIGAVGARATEQEAWQLYTEANGSDSTFQPIGANLAMPESLTPNINALSVWSSVLSGLLRQIGPTLLKSVLPGLEQKINDTLAPYLTKTGLTTDQITSVEYQVWRLFNDALANALGGFDPMVAHTTINQITPTDDAVR